jgi:hypothetical protein
VLWLAGCGGTTSPDQIQTVEGALDRGLEAIEAADWSTADAELTLAIEEGGLNPDLIEAAYLGRARARIELDDLSAADEDLNTIAENAAAMDQVWLLRGQLAERRGDQAGMTAAYGTAKKLNKNIKINIVVK